MGGLHPSAYGGAYSTMPKQTGNALYQNMDPPQMSQVPQYLSRFVAGPARLESNPLGEPLRTLRTISPGASTSGRPTMAPSIQDYDLKNPDVQYERYKHLMSNQYYNNNVNSMQLIHPSLNMTQAHTVYRPPSTFTHTGSELQS